MLTSHEQRLPEIHERRCGRGDVAGGGSVVFFHAEQASYKKGLRLLLRGTRDVDALEERTARTTTGAGRRLLQAVRRVENGSITILGQFWI